MKNGVERTNCEATRKVSRSNRNSILPLAAIACLGIALADCGAQQMMNDHYNIHDLGVVGPNPGQPFVISGGGWTSGSASVDGAEHAVLWRGTAMIDIGNPGFGGNSISFGVNNAGSAVGEAETIAGPA